MIGFYPPTVDKIVRTIGNARPAGEMEDVQRVVCTVGPNPVAGDMELCTGTSARS